MNKNLLETNQQIEDKSIPQYNFWQTILMFIWPLLWYSVLIYGIGRFIIFRGEIIQTWFQLLVMVLGPGAELVVALLLLRMEGYELKLASLRKRIRWDWPKGTKIWIVAVVVLILGMSLSMAMGPVNRMLATVPGFIPPSWWPVSSNPTVQIKSAADVFPDISLTGNISFFLIYFLITLIFNIFGEEIYYRGFLLPKMQSAFGRWDWIINGFLFTLKHAYQRWLYPGILIGGLSFAFAAGPLGSLPLAMVYHWIGNFLFQVFYLARSVFGF